MHSNQTGWVQGLRSLGYQVTYMVQHIGWTEHHTELTPTIVEPSILCRLPWFRLAFTSGKAMWFRRGRVIPSLMQTWRLLKKTHPDAIVVRQVTAATAVVGVLGRLFTRRIVFYVQQPLRSHHRPSFKSRIRRTLISAFFAKTITPVRGSGPHRFTHGARFVPFAVLPSPEAQERSYLNRGRVRILCVAKLFSKRKNHMILFEALASLAMAHDFRLTLIGALNDEHDPHYVQLLRYLEDSLLRDRTTVLPNIPYGKVLREYLSHDIFVLPSEDEPASVSNLEAMAAGMAVICTSSNGTCDYLPSPEAGLRVVAADIESLREALQGLVSEPRRIVSIGQSAYDICRRWYAPDVVGKRIEVVLFGGS